MRQYVTYDVLFQRLCAGCGPWWLARIYGNYDGELDCYVKFSDDRAAVHHYVLEMPPASIVPGADAASYPEPSLWYYATGKRYICRYTDDEWAAYGATVSA